MALIESLIDGFDTAAASTAAVQIQPFWTASYGTVSISGSNGRMDLTSDGATSSIQSPKIYSLKNSALSTKVVTVPVVGGGTDVSTSMQASQVDGSAFLSMTYIATTGVLAFRNVFADVAAAITFDIVAMAYWRIREGTGKCGNLAVGTPGTIYFDTSPNGVTWTNRASGASPAWITTANDTGIALTAHRDLGTADFARYANINVLPSVPNAPTAVTGVIGNAQVALSWTAPSNTGGLTLTDYRITATPAPATGLATQALGGIGTNYTFAGLSNGTAYTFTVAAVNSAGVGTSSAASAALTPAAPSSAVKLQTLVDDFSINDLASRFPGSIPSPGTNPVVASGFVQATATASLAGLDTGSNLYDLTASYVLAKMTVPTAGGTTVRARLALQNGTTGGTDLRAEWDDSGTIIFGQRSVGYVTVGVNGAKAAAAGSTFWVAIVEGLARFQFDGVAGVAGTTYFFYSLNTYDTWALQSSSATPSWAATSCKVQLLVQNAAGTSTATFDSVNVPDHALGSTAVSPPSALVATGGDSSALVAFAASPSPGVTAYTVTASPGGATGAAASSPVTVTGLSNGTTYIFTATATSNTGVSPASGASNAVTPAQAVAVPGVPTAVTVLRSADPTLATLTWLAPNSGGGGVTSYTVTVDGVSKGTQTSPYTANQLSNTTHTVAVNAVNPAGAGPATSVVLPAFTGGSLQPLGSVSDNFNSATLDPAWTIVSAGVTQANGAVFVTGPLTSSSQYLLREGGFVGQTAFLKMTRSFTGPGDVEGLVLRSASDFSQRFRIYVVDGVLYAAYEAGKPDSAQTGTPFDATKHIYWRFRHAAASSLMYLETSVDTITWTPLGRTAIAAPSWLTDVQFGLELYNGLAVVPPTSLPSVPLQLVASAVTTSSATLSWQQPASSGSSALTAFTYSRDGSDSNGAGAYRADTAATTFSAAYSNLLPSTTYQLAVSAKNAAGSGPAASVSITTGAVVIPPKPPGVTFEDNFLVFDTVNTWYGCYPYALAGAADESSSGGSWNAGSALVNGVAYNPYLVISDTTATTGKALRISCRRQSLIGNGAKTGTSGANWVGGEVVSQQTFTYGYFEWRMRLPNPGLGMFPALWMFDAVSGAVRDDFAHSRAELDLMKVFGTAVGNPWNTAVQLKDQGGAGSQFPLSAKADDTTGWHTYGMDWQAGTLRFYKDGVETANGDQYAYFFVGLHMQLRMNYSVGDNLTWMPHTDVTTPDELHMDVDYIRCYATRPLPSDVPTVPTAVTGTPGAGSALIAWSPPASPGSSAITGYRVTRNGNDVTQTNGAGYSTDVALTVSEFTMSGLISGTTYRLTVAALNTSGPGPAASVDVAVPSVSAGGTGTTPGNPGTATVTVAPDFTAAGATISPLNIGAVSTTYGTSPLASATQAQYERGLDGRYARIPVRWSGTKVVSSAGGIPLGGGPDILALVRLYQSWGWRLIIVIAGRTSDWDGYQNGDAAAIKNVLGTSNIDYSGPNEPDNGGHTASDVVTRDLQIAGEIGVPIWGPVKASYDRTFIAAVLDGVKNGGRQIGGVDYHHYAMGSNYNDVPTAMGITPVFETEINNSQADLASRGFPQNVSVDEYNYSWRYNIGGHLVSEFFSAVATVWHASVVGHILRAGGRGAAFGFQNGALGLIEEPGNTNPDGRPNNTPFPAYWGTAMHTGFQNFSHFNNALYPASSTVTNVECFPANNEAGGYNIVLVNKDQTANQIVQVNCNGGLAAGTYDQWSTNPAKPYDAPVKTGPWTFTGGSIKVPLAAMSVITLVLKA